MRAMVSLSEIVSFIRENFDWLSIFVIILIFSYFSIKYFRNKETQKKEPIVLLLFAVGLGIVSIIPSVILSLLMLLVIPESYSAFIIAPIAEEIGKGLILGVIAWTSLVEDPLDGMVYGGMVGIGFAAVENFLYAYSALTSEGLGAGIFLATFRSAFQVIGHPLYTGITGYGIGLYKKGISNRKFNKIWLAMTLHAIWNGVPTYFSEIYFFALGGVIIFSILVMQIFTTKARSLN